MIVRAPSNPRSLRFEWETTNPGHLFLVSAGIRAENSQPNLTTSLNESPTPYGRMIGPDVVWSQTPSRQAENQLLKRIDPSCTQNFLHSFKRHEPDRSQRPQPEDILRRGLAHQSVAHGQVLCHKVGITH
jgi:hypothetical protein